jgi:hypothetical protein
MIVLLHVITALISVIYASGTFLKPSKTKLRISYGLVGATFVSGTYLVISTRSNLVSSCLAGLVYIAVVSCGLIPARLRLKSAED